MMGSISFPNGWLNLVIDIKT
ncbi:hypothetical protein BGLA2_780058 [Burkholderia gladioli]|nr:hypothetical protein BGLA2_780058 [Burkholderia gladioli]